MKTIARGVSVLLATLTLAGSASAQVEQKPALEARLAALFAPKGGLTADDVAGRAAATSYDVRAKHADVEAAAAQVDDAVARFFPRVSAKASYLKLSPIPDANLGTLVSPANLKADKPTALAPGAPLVAVPFIIPSLSNQTTLEASVVIPVSDYVLRIAQGYSASSRSLKAAEHTEHAAKLDAALGGRLAYYTWARARLSAVVAQQSLDQARQHLSDARHAAEVGTASKADVARVEAQVAGGENLVHRAQGLVRTAEEALRVAMHEPAAAARAPYAMGEDLRATLPSLGPTRDLAALQSEAVSRRLEVKALDETAGALGQQARIARATAFPRVDLLGQVSYDNPDLRVFPPVQEFTAGWAVGVQATWSPNDVAAGIFAGRQVEGKRAAVVAQRQRLVDALEVEVSQAAQAVEDAEVGIATGGRALAAAEESYRVRRELFVAGRVASVELTDAETELLRSSLDLVNARVDLRIARARLQHALGRDV